LKEFNLPSSLRLCSLATLRETNPSASLREKKGHSQQTTPLAYI